MVFAKLGGNKEQIWGQLPPRSPWLRTSRAWSITWLTTPLPYVTVRSTVYCP